MEFVATCPAGFEQLLAQELRALKVPQVRPLRGQVAFAGELTSAYRVCLWSRLASRVVAVLARGGARDADELYETVSSVAWEDQLPVGTSFAIDAQGTNQQLRSTQFVALRAKDALVDRMQARRGTRPVADAHAEGLRIAVRVSRERASVGIDLAGRPLFRRGYEPSAATQLPATPLRPDYAAALLAAGGWAQLCARGPAVLVAPFAGPGTIAVEAAAQATDQAPGLQRHRWGFEAWAQHEQGAWQELHGEARQRAREAAGQPVMLLLDDPRRGCELPTRQMLSAAGLACSPTFGIGDATPFDLETGGLLACDLSWLDPVRHAAQAGDALARLAQAKSLLSGDAHASVLASHDLADRMLGTPDHAVAVYVGREEATLRSYDKPSTSANACCQLPDGTQVPLLVAASGQFAARLAKVHKQRRKWARREDVSCYRIYDADLPDYAVSIDLFEGSQAPGRWLQVYEYAPPKSVDASLAQARLLDVMGIAPRLLGVKPQDVFLRVRSRARGGSQYADEARHPGKARQGRTARKGTPLPPGAHLIDEGGLTFEVNFSTRLDCGIFLDHRDTRAMLREMAKRTKGSKRFLNLFAYTGTATCYAADGGARHTTTVDLSRPSLDWARRNMERNGFTGPEHEFVQADVLAWVSEQRHTKNRWDLVFCDVPTFSNSQRMRSASFDVQRDHAELLIDVSRLLTREGTCVFSCNLRTFKLDEETLAKAGVEAQDITTQTIPEDFSRNQRIHTCFLVRRTPRA